MKKRDFFSKHVFGLLSKQASRINRFLMLVFGVIGLIMRKTKVPHMPLVIGLVMGPIAEPNYIRALRISLGSYGTFFSSPISKLLWLVIAGTIFSTYVAPIIKKQIEKKKSMKGN